MATYVSLCQWTQKGGENLRHSPGSIDRVKEMIRSAGGQLKAFYLTMGRFDFVVVLEMPDDASLAKLLLKLGAANIWSETLIAFEETDYRLLLGSV